MKQCIDKIQTVIQRPGMFLVEDNLSYAIAFISGLNHGLQHKPLEGFQSWLVREYFEEPQAFAWEALIRRLEDCSTDNEQENARAFLVILDRYVANLY